MSESIGSSKSKHGIASANGVNIAYEVSGDGPPLICGHAMGWDRSLWDDHRALLSEHFTLITFDQRGAGDSDHPASEKSYTPSAFAQDLRSVLDQLNIDRANVLGFSMGAIAALNFAIESPERVIKLVLVSAMASKLPDKIIERAQLVGEAVKQTSLSEAYEFYFSGPMFEGTLKKVEIVKKMRHVIAKATKQGFLGCFKVTIERESIVDQLSDVSAPTLVMVGERDTHYVVEADLLIEEIPNAQLCVIADAGHALTVQQQTMFERRLINFLA